ncbi:MAG: gliding motility-associated C-terminal domain-containing protein [Ferruginibacter sp.]|nr:gliding motility-associated C-terminal domain-containing protein [Ferruginibacter sp.]
MNIIIRNTSKAFHAFFLTAIFLVFGISSFAQPSNDDPCAATPLQVNTTCVRTTSTTNGATSTTGVSDPSCGYYQGEDVWFSLVVPANGNVLIQSWPGEITDGAMAVYTGTCANLNELSCNGDLGVGGTLSTILVTNQAPGTTIFVRFWAWGGFDVGEFEICASEYTPPAAPANDECSSAIALTVNPDQSCAVTTAGSTRGATQSTGTIPTCGASGINDDVWYTFVATNNMHTISIQNVSGTTDMVMQVYAQDCSSLLPVACSDPEYMLVPNLQPGQTYYVRVYTWSSSMDTRADFNICVGSLAPVNNDDCSAAINVPVNPDLNCAQTVAGTTGGATQSNGETNPGCAASGLNDDVWYSFVATNPSHFVSLVNNSGPTTDFVMAVYRGNCGNLQVIRCSDPETMQVNGLTPGQTYYIRVWTYSSTTTIFGNFNVCITTPPPPPSYDEPCSAQLLTVEYTCNYQSFHNMGATASAGIPAPGCADYQGSDVWFKVVVPCEKTLIIDTKQGMITDGGMAAYSAPSCNGPFTLIKCDDDSSPNGFMPMLYLSNLNQGDTIYIRFWNAWSSNPGSFEICASIPPPSSTSTSCTTAQPFCTSQNYSLPSSTNVPSLGTMGCLYSTPNPVWYYIEVQNAGDIIIDISQVDIGGVGRDVDYAVWGPFSSAAAACSGMTDGNIVSCSYSAAPTETATILNAQPGQFYMFLLTNYSNQPATINFQQSGGTGQSNCGALCNIDADNNGPVCADGYVDLTTPGFGGATYHWTGPRCFESTVQNPTQVQVPPIPGVFTYFVEAVDPVSGIKCYGFTEVTVVARVKLGADSSVIACPGSIVNLTTFYDTTGLTATWTLNGSPVATPDAVSAAGIYELVAVNSANCSDTAYVTIIAGTLTFASDTAINRCSGVSANLTEVFNTTGFTTAYEFNNAPVADPTAVSIPGIYDLIVTNADGCKDTVKITVSFDNVTATQTTVNANCTDEGTITITTGTGTAPFEYGLGVDPDSYQSTNTFSVPEGSYTVTVRDAQGCKTEISGIEVGFTDNLTMDDLQNVSICGDNSATITVNGNAASYAWSPSTGLNTASGSTVTANPSSTTTYTVTGTLGSCVKDKVVTVSVELPISVDAGSDLVILSGGTATINATSTGDIASILWSPSIWLSDATILNPVVTPVGTPQTITYLVTVTSPLGCTATDELTITLESPDCIKIRNAFSPNGDGINDVWKVYDSYGCLGNVTVHVYNRYGHKVFESKDYRNTWDGRYQNKAVPDGTYYAVVVYTLTDGTKKFVRTDLTIIR